MYTKIDLSEQQLLGFSHRNQGYSLISLIESMGLTQNEWKVLKKKYGLEYLSKTDKKEINQYFLKNK